MKITKVIAWIREDSADELVVVHSGPINDPEATEAWQQFKKGKAIAGVVPMVFLDKELNTPALRSLIQAEAVRRTTPDAP